jgi:NAD+ synthase (glutamine-hydrolysing)
MKPSIHQINTVTGDITGNFAKIKALILEDKENGADLSIFPETAITGYMCGALWDRIDFVEEQQSKIFSLVNYVKEIGYKGTVIIGFVEFRGLKGNGFPLLYNSAAVIDSLRIRIYNKQILASADHHEDKKYFDRGIESKVLNCNLSNGKTVRIGILICEDAWINDHHKNIPSELVDHGAEFLVHINQSYFYYGKQEKRYNLLKEISELLQVPIISVNSVGVGDILKNIVIFDGGSFWIHNGKLLWEGPRFEEFNGIPEIPLGLPIFSPASKYKGISEAIIFEQQEFFRLMGIKKAQVHVSGGLDSAIVAALVSKAMGKENTVLITNPSDLNTKSLKYVEQLEKNLNIGIYNNPIQKVYEELIKNLSNSFKSDLSLSGKSCAQAVLRTVQGLAASHMFDSGIVATGNHTEIVLGWATFHDIGSIGVHAIIGDLTKVELYELAEYINKYLYKEEIIPEDLFNGKFKPAAELPDANEDPIDYWIQSGICAMLIRDRKNKKDIVDELVGTIPNRDYFPNIDEVRKYSKEEIEKQVDFAINKMRRSVYKAAQGAPIVIISPRSRGFSNRETLINFYK